MFVKKSLLVLLATVFGCIVTVTDASAWTSISPGAGGAATAIDADPASGIVLAGSDVGGMRYSNDSGATWHNVSKGIIQKDGYSSAKNFQAVKIFTVGGTRLAVATTTAGVIYWSYITDNYWETYWTELFDSQTRPGWKGKKIPFGAIAVAIDGSKIFVGVGNINALARNDALKDIPASKAGTVLVFNVIKSTTGAVTFNLYAEINLDCNASNCQVSDLDSPYAVRAPDLADVLVSTTEAIYKLIDRGADLSGKGQFDVKNKTGSLSGALFLSIAGNKFNMRDVVVLLDENRDGDGKITDGGGVYRTTAFGSRSPGWESRIGNLPIGRGMGKLRRSRTNPSQVVVSADVKKWTDKDKDKGVYFNEAIASLTPVWVELMNNSVPSVLDGWTRFSGNDNYQIKEIAIKDDADGIGEIYVGGFSGFIFRGVRVGARDNDTLYVCNDNAPIFCFSQIYSTRYGTDSTNYSYTSRGIPLAVPSAEVYINPDNTDQIYSLYVDNIFFVSPDQGASFSRPIYKWGMGTGVVFVPAATENDPAMSYVSYVKGNNDFDTATGGGIFMSDDDGESFEELSFTSPSANTSDNPFPADPVISAFTKFNGYFVCAVWGKGVYRSADAMEWAFMGLAGQNVNKLVVAEIDGSDVLLASYNKRNDDYLFNYYVSGTTWYNIPRSKIQSVKNFRNVNGYLVVTEDDNEGYYAAIPATTGSFPDLTWTKLGKEFSDIAYDSFTSKYYIATATDGIHSATDFTDITGQIDGWKPMTSAGLGGTKTFKYISVSPTGQVYVGANGAWGFFRR